MASSNDLLVRRGRPAARPAGAAEKLAAEVFGHDRADDLAHWRGDGGAAVAIKRGGELAAFAYRRGERIGPAAGRDETALLQAVAAAAAAGAGSGRGVTMRVPGACASLLEALVSCGFRLGDPTLFLASRVRPTRALPPIGAHPLLGAGTTRGLGLVEGELGHVERVERGTAAASLIWLASFVSCSRIAASTVGSWPPDRLTTHGGSATMSRFDT